MLAPWPVVNQHAEDPRAEAEGEFVMRLVTAIRTVRAEMEIPPSRRLSLLVLGEEPVINLLRRHESLVSALARLDSWQVLDGEVPPGAATAVLPELRLFIPLAGVIDLEAEAVRLNKAIARLDADLSRVVGKLSNEAFVANAKPEVVASERAKEREMGQKRLGLVEALERLQRMRGSA